MSVLDEVISTAKNTAVTIGEQSAKLYDLAKLKISASDLKSSIAKQYKILGERVYNAEKKGDTAKTEDIVMAVDVLKSKLEAVNDKIAAAKNNVRCEDCGTYNSVESRFCSDCGAPVIQPETEDTEAPADFVREDEEAEETSAEADTE